MVATPKHFAVHSGPEPERHALRRQVARTRPARDLPARTSRRACARRSADSRDVRLQPRQRRAGAARSDDCCSATSCAASGASTATSSPTAARSTTSSGTHKVVPTAPRRRRRSRCRAAPTSTAATSTKHLGGRGASAGCSAKRRSTARSSACSRPLQARHVRSAGARAVGADPARVVDTPEHRALARAAAARVDRAAEERGRAAAARRRSRPIAVIGPNADDVGVLLGNYNGTPATPSRRWRDPQRRRRRRGALARGSDLAEGRAGQRSDRRRFGYRAQFRAAFRGWSAGAHRALLQASAWQRRHRALMPVCGT